MKKNPQLESLGTLIFKRQKLTKNKTNKTTTKRKANLRSRGENVYPVVTDPN